jgi:precorrin-6B methylase 2
VTRRCAVVIAALVAAPALMAQTRAPTPDIHYVPTPTNVVDVMLARAHVTSDDVVYDLGSGDGRIVVTAAKKYGARGVGVELDSKLIAEARENARKAGVGDRVRFIQGDLFKTDLSEATVVTLFLSPSVNLRLRSKLQRELQAGARIVSYRFPIADWRPDGEVEVGGQPVYSWKVE